jgi:hypothetical protein
MLSRGLRLSFVKLHRLYDIIYLWAIKAYFNKVLMLKLSLAFSIALAAFTSYDYLYFYVADHYYSYLIPKLQSILSNANMEVIGRAYEREAFFNPDLDWSEEPDFEEQKANSITAEEAAIREAGQAAVELKEATDKKQSISVAEEQHKSFFARNWPYLVLIACAILPCAIAGTVPQDSVLTK